MNENNETRPLTRRQQAWKDAHAVAGNDDLFGWWLDMLRNGRRLPCDEGDLRETLRSFNAQKVSPLPLSDYDL